MLASHTMNSLTIASRKIDINQPTYFIADIAANHDGNLEKAKELIELCKEAGAEAAKFQHFRAPHIVSDYGFKNLGSQQSHQASWKKSVYEVYEAASLNWEWTAELKKYSDRVGIHFFSSPYDAGAVDHLDPHVPAYKIGSGDITFEQLLTYIAKKNKPVILAAGASTMEDVNRAVRWVREHNPQVALLQCNTNYTGSDENLRYINLNVLKTFQEHYPDMVIGLSDHTHGHVTVLGAVALGARIIEKHFTDDNNRDGPDHGFSMNLASFREMVLRTRDLESALGNGIKRVEDNETQTVVLQRRCIRATRDLAAGHVLTMDDIESLRPAPLNSVLPYELPQLLGKKLLKSMERGQHFEWSSIEKK